MQREMGIDFGAMYLGALDRSLELFELLFLRPLSAVSGLFISIRTNRRQIFTLLIR